MKGTRNRSKEVARIDGRNEGANGRRIRQLSTITSLFHIPLVYIVHLSVESLQVTQANENLTQWNIGIRSSVFFVDRTADLSIKRVMLRGRMELDRKQVGTRQHAWALWDILTSKSSHASCASPSASPSMYSSSVCTCSSSSYIRRN